MNVLIISDSHGLTNEIDEITKRHKDEVDLLLHCGDSELAKDSEHLAPYSIVKGNCDFGEDFPNEIIHDMNGYKLYMTHGHLYNVKATLMNLKYRAEEIGADIICYGHSHIAAVEKNDNRLFINPGSIRLPVLSRKKTYAILEVEKDHVNVNFFEVTGEKVNELSNQFNL
ncbi:metallophosphoesterase family protein [Metabacillus malikii]|uniref:Phosphoesterase n=1 Tax=Metabacillus malikii TaxID=1504265 RepID=A0ABT9ZIB8_9BACI|nr:metallophosphoesterase [Metabacillus malikii]MDQ0230960.1 putative phosphoesterase [Metabacillus malikii]